MHKLNKVIILQIFFCFFSTNILLAQVKDVDNNDYDTTKIGNFTWLTKNLAVTHFRNGDEIHMATSFEDWNTYNNNHQPAYMYYKFDPVYGMDYGVLYNFYAIEDKRGLAPKGYHIPSTVEWQKFFISLPDSLSTGDLLSGRWNADIREKLIIFKLVNFANFNYYYKKVIIRLYEYFNNGRSRLYWLTFIC